MILHRTWDLNYVFDNEILVYMSDSSFGSITCAQVAIILGLEFQTLGFGILSLELWIRMGDKKEKFLIVFPCICDLLGY